MTDVRRAAPAQPRRNHLLLLYAGWFLVDVDLIVITPLLVPISDHFHADLSTVTLALTAYLLLFGLMQPVYGNYSDSVGRVRVLRIGLFGIFAANLVAALAPNLAILIAARGAAGAFAGAIVPVTAAYVGDVVAPQRRQQALAALLSVSALGIAAGTIGGGLLVDLMSWRVAIGLVAATALVLALLYSRLPEVIVSKSGRAIVLSRIGEVWHSGWFRFLVAFTFIEGASMVGFYNFFNAALQVHGNPAMVAGLVTSSYGVGAVAGGLLVRAVHNRISAAAMFGGGTALLTLGYAVAAYSQSIPGILVASVLSGMALSTAQSTLQDWTIAVAPVPVRGTAVSLIACAVFTGGAVSTVAVSGFAADGRFGVLFAIAAMVTAPIAVVGTLARYAFDTQQSRRSTDKESSGKLD
jgi:predicted MFS family arabinose efflux permease